MLECAVALVMLVDVSRSVSPPNYILQRDGIAAAFVDKRVQEAISFQSGGVAISIIEWSDTPVISVPWTIIKNANDSKALSLEISSLKRPEGINTQLTDALEAGVKLFESTPCIPRSKIIDVSGDGTNSFGIGPEHIRDTADANDIIINGLAIVTESEPHLYEYYKSSVITPTGFVLEAKGFDDFTKTIRRKILTEVSFSTFDTNTNYIGPI